MGKSVPTAMASRLWLRQGRANLQPRKALSPKLSLYGGRLTEQPWVADPHVKGVAINDLAGGQ